MSYDINKVIKVAEAEVGYLEKNNKTNLNDKTTGAGSGNYTKYWQDLASGMQGQSWCQCFINWCFVQAYGTTDAKKLLCTTGGWSYYTPTSAQYFKSKGQWYSTPKAGDIIYYKNSSRICHVGLVYKVSNSKVYTIEGNTSGGKDIVANGGGVFKKEYYLNNSRIAGYGRPNYGTSISTTTALTIKNVITASQLNIRESSNTHSSILGVYNKGDNVTIDAVEEGWYHTPQGWISAKYVQSNSAIVKTELNIRQGPGTLYNISGKYAEGEQVIILAENNKWFLTPKGWCSGSYLS